MDSLKVVNDIISEKIKRNLSMVEFHKKEVERYESIISELDELRDDLEFEFDCEDQTYKYNDQTQRFDKVTNTKENTEIIFPETSSSWGKITNVILSDGEREEDEDEWNDYYDEDDDIDLFRDELDDEEEDIHKLKVGDDCLYCDDGWIEMSLSDDGMRKIFRCPECDYMYSWRDVEYD